LRLGILADVHEATDQLREAIQSLNARGVDRFVFLGDLCDSGRAIAESTALLDEVGAIGVYGNHDLGLALEPDDHFRQRYGADVLTFFAALQGRHEEADCLFTHSQAWMGPADLEQPWYLHGLPTEPDLLPRNFAATERRVLFQGHYHRWLAATPQGPLLWKGDEPLHLHAGQRYLVVVHAVCHGWCAHYDTETGELRPVRLSSAAPDRSASRTVLT
jgi:predicted phosphodiesterase